MNLKLKRVQSRFFDQRLLKRAIAALLLFFLLSSSDQSYSLPVIPPNSIILDDEVDLGFKDFFDTLLKVTGKKQRTFTPKTYLVAHSSVNAASGTGGQFIIYSGLFRLCDSVEEFFGVLAHELAHGKGLHSVQASVGSEKAFLTAAVAFALGGVAALAAKDAAPLMAGVAGGQNAYVGSTMRTMQNIEKAADAEAVKILAKASIPATGLMTFLKKIQKAYGSPDLNPYFLDHPLTEDRIQAIQHDAEKTATLHWSKKEYFQKTFDRLRAKILAFTMEPKHVLTMFSGQTMNDSYARAVALGRQSHTQAALNEIEHILSKEPRNPYVLELKSQLLMDAGRKDDSIKILSEAVTIKPQATYLKMSLAHLLVEQRSHVAEAIRHLNDILIKNRDNDFAWHLLGKAYMINGQEAHALWANAEYDALRGDKNAAKAKLQHSRAKAGNNKVLIQKLSDLEKSL